MELPTLARSNRLVSDPLIDDGPIAGKRRWPVAIPMIRWALLLGLLGAALKAQSGYYEVHTGLNDVPALHGLTRGPAGFVAVGDAGYILYSTDGQAWRPVSSGVTLNLESVASGPGGYVAVGDNGLIVVSSDGQSWSQITQKVTTARLNSIATDGQSFIAVGEQGASLQSPTGITWTALPSGTTQSLRSIAAKDAGWVCVGAGGTVLYNAWNGGWQSLASRTTSDLTSVTLVSYSARDIISAGGPYPNWEFEAVGTDGNLYQIGMAIPESSPSITVVPVTSSDQLQAIVGAGWWSNGQSTTNYGVGFRLEAAEVLAFGLDGSSYRAQNELSGTSSGWRKSTYQYIPTITGAYADLVGNAIYEFGNRGAIYYQPAVFRSRIQNFSVLNNIDANSPETLGVVTTSGPYVGSVFALTRAVGPGLADFGVPSPLPAPQLSPPIPPGAAAIFESGWAQQLANTFTTVGAFPLAPNSNDSAVLGGMGSVTSTVIAALPNQHGNVLAELYDADPAIDGFPSIVNCSMLLHLPAGGSAAVGFVIQGPAQPSFLLRAVGPALSTFGVANALPDPVLKTNSYRSPYGVLQSFMTSPFTLAQATAATGAFPLPAGAQNPVILAMGAGQFTATVTSASGASGDVLIELYLVPLNAVTPN